MPRFPPNCNDNGREALPVKARADPRLLFAQTPALQHKVFIGLPAGVKIKGFCAPPVPLPLLAKRVYLTLQESL